MPEQSNAVGSVTMQLKRMQEGDPEGAQEIWERYYSRLVWTAKHKLGSASRRVADEEDVAITAFTSFCSAVDDGRFPQLADRDDLWQILLMLVSRRGRGPATRIHAETPRWWRGPRRDLSKPDSRQARRTAKSGRNGQPSAYGRIRL